MKSAPKPAPPMACARRNAIRSYCARDIGDDEYTFLDAGHALSHYENGAHLRLCPLCAISIRADS